MPHSPETDPFLDKDAEVLTNPSEKVEEFLRDNKVLFSLDLAAWQKVKEQIEIFDRFWAEHVAIIQIPKTNNDFAKHERNHFQLSVKLSQLRSFGQFSQALARDSEAVKLSDEEKIQATTTHLEEQRGVYEAKLKNGLLAELEELRIPGRFNPIIEHIVRTKSDETLAKAMASLDFAYITAYFSSNLVLWRAYELLEQQDTVLPFIDALEDIASLQQSGLAEYPGLLETLATHLKERGEANIFNPAIEQSFASPHRMAPEFLHAMLGSASNEHTGFKKDLACALGALSLAAELKWPSLQEFINDYCLAQDRWPDPLKRQLELFAGRHKQHAQQRLRAILEPFAKSARIPSKHQGISDFAASARKKGGLSRKPLAQLKQDMSDVTTPEATITAITQIGFLQRSEEGFALETVGSIDEAMEHPNIKSYTDKYRSEATLAQVIRAGIADLCTTPFSSASRCLGTLEYRLNRPGAPRRKARRFSLQRFPHSAKGPIATRTRIIYTIEQVNGQLYLAIYGPVLKQTIDNPSSLREFPKLV